MTTHVATTYLKYANLQMAAEVLKGRKIASNVRLLVAPSTQKVYADAAADGTLNILTDAGATMLASGCGACAALGAGVVCAEATKATPCTSVEATIRPSVSHAWRRDFAADSGCFMVNSPSEALMCVDKDYIANTRIKA